MLPFDVTAPQAIYAELDDLHRDCIARLNRMGWAVVDMTMSMELMKEETDAAIELCRTLTPAASGGSAPGTTGEAAAVGHPALFACQQPYIVDAGRQAGAAMAGAGVRL